MVEFERRGEALKAIHNIITELLQLASLDFEHGLEAWERTGAVKEETSTVYLGKKACRLKPGAKIGQAVYPALPVGFTGEAQTLLFLKPFFYGAAVGDQVKGRYYVRDGNFTEFIHTITEGNKETWVQPNWYSTKFGSHIARIEIWTPETNNGDIIVDFIPLVVRPERDIVNRVARELGKVSIRPEALPLPVNVQAIPNILVQNLNDIINGDFETGDFTGFINHVPTKITINDSLTYVYTGKYSCRLKYDSSLKGLMQMFSPALPSGCIHRVMVFRADSSSLTAKFYFTDGTTETKNFQPPNIATWAAGNIRPLTGKPVAAIEFYNGYSLGQHLYIDAYKIMPPVLAALGWNEKNYLGSAGSETLPSSGENIYLNLSSEELAKLERLIVWANHSNIAIHIDHGDFAYWLGDEYATFEQINAVGGEDHLMKLLTYNLNGNCCAMLKKPVTGTGLYVSLTEESGNNRNVWVEGEYHLL